MTYDEWCVSAPFVVAVAALRPLRRPGSIGATESFVSQNHSHASGASYAGR
jgi:hypothetical protein